MLETFPCHGTILAFRLQLLGRVYDRGWLRDGKIKAEETVENGVENAPKAFLNLFSGGNTGKMLVKLG